MRWTGIRFPSSPDRVWSQTRSRLSENVNRVKLRLHSKDRSFRNWRPKLSQSQWANYGHWNHTSHHETWHETRSTMNFTTTSESVTREASHHTLQTTTAWTLSCPESTETRANAHNTNSYQLSSANPSPMNSFTSSNQFTKFVIQNI